MLCLLESLDGSVLMDSTGVGLSLWLMVGRVFHVRWTPP